MNFVKTRKSYWLFSNTSINFNFNYTRLSATIFILPKRSSTFTCCAILSCPMLCERERVFFFCWTLFEPIPSFPFDPSYHSYSSCPVDWLLSQTRNAKPRKDRSLSQIGCMPVCLCVCLSSFTVYVCVCSCVDTFIFILSLPVLPRPSLSCLPSSFPLLPSLVLFSSFISDTILPYDRLLIYLLIWRSLSLPPS